MSTQAKSVVMLSVAWERMISIHVDPVRPRVGLMPAARRIFHTVDAAIRCPSRVSSPWTAGSPSSDFPAPVEHPGKHREDRPVGVGELCAFDLALGNEKLVSQREDLGVALIAGGEHPSEA